MDACKIDVALIADQDYLEQVGTAGVKQLFVTNTREIKEDVLDKVKSLDGNALVRAIGSALATGNWDDAKGLWEYIKSARRELRTNLSPEQAALVNQCIDELRQRYVCSKAGGAGALSPSWLETKTWTSSFAGTSSGFLVAA